MKSVSYLIFSGLCFFGSCIIFSMEEESFFFTHELFVDGGTPRENIGLFNYPQIGVYAHPYRMVTPYLAVHSEALLNCMPDSIEKSLVGIYGGADDLRATLVNRIIARDLNVAFLLIPSLPDNPQAYNVVFHPIVAGWLGKTPREGFNVHIQAGIFNPLGVQPATEPITFGTLGSLNVNLHDIDNYSPNNGRFSLESGRAVASFWVMGALQQHATVAYVLMLNQAALENTFKDMVSGLVSLSSPQKQLEYLIQNFESIAKQLESDGKSADSNTLIDALQCLRTIYAKKFSPQVVQCQKSTRASSPRRKSLEVLQLPIPPVLKPIPPLSAEAQEELDLLHVQLLSLGYALEQ